MEVRPRRYELPPPAECVTRAAAAAVVVATTKGTAASGVRERRPTTRRWVRKNAYPAVGTPGKGLADGEAPTVYAAHERGFEVQELRLMFWSPELALSLTGLIDAPYSDPITRDDE